MAPIELDPEKFDVEVMLLDLKYHIAPSQSWLQETIRAGYVCTLVGEFVKKKPLRPLWREFVLTTWEQQQPAMSKASRKIDPFDMTNLDISLDQATAFLKWLAPRRSTQRNMKGYVIDGTSWWPWHAESILEANKEEQAKHILDLEEEAARSVRWRCDGQTKVKVLEWLLKVERVNIQEAMLLGMVSPEYDRRAPKPETLLRPEEERQVEWELDDDDEEQQYDIGGDVARLEGFGKTVPLKENSSQESAKAPVAVGEKVMKKTRTAPTAPTTTKHSLGKRTRSGK